MFPTISSTAADAWPTLELWRVMELSRAAMFLAISSTAAEDSPTLRVCSPLSWRTRSTPPESRERESAITAASCFSVTPEAESVRWLFLISRIPCSMFSLKSFTMPAIVPTSSTEQMYTRRVRSFLAEERFSSWAITEQ